jgi:hypothetical protein
MAPAARRAARVAMKVADRHHPPRSFVPKRVRDERAARIVGAHRRGAARDDQCDDERLHVPFLHHAELMVPACFVLKTLMRAITVLGLLTLVSCSHGSHQPGSDAATGPVSDAAVDAATHDAAPSNHDAGPSNGTAFAPNLPAGFTKIWDRQWDKTDSTIPGGVLPPASLSGTDSYNMAWQSGDGASKAPLIDTPANLTSVIGTTITTPPDGHPTALAVLYPSGEPGGTLPFGLSAVGSVSFTKMYVSFYVYMPSGFDSNGNNIKWLGVGNGPTANHIFMLCAGAPNEDYRAAWMTLQGNVNAELGGGGTRTDATTQLHPTNPPPQGTGVGWWQSMQGQWVNVEWYADIGSGTNGVFRSWVTLPGQSPVLINEWTNLNFGTSNFGAASFIPYYGGGGGAAPSNQYIVVGRAAVYGSN